MIVKAAFCFSTFQLCCTALIQFLVAIIIIIIISQTSSVIKDRRRPESARIYVILLLLFFIYYYWEQWKEVCLDIVEPVRHCDSVFLTSWRTRRSWTVSRTTTQQNVGSHNCWRTLTIRGSLQVLEQLQCRLNRSFSPIVIFFHACTFQNGAAHELFRWPFFW